MIKCLVIDGWHKGHSIDLPDIIPAISLHRPPIKTICDDYDEGPDIYEVKSSVNDYMLAFQSMDGKMALYSVNGSSESLINNRDFVTHKNGSAWKDTPIIVGCHDERAVFKESTK